MREGCSNRSMGARVIKLPRKIRVHTLGAIMGMLVMEILYQFLNV